MLLSAAADRLEVDVSTLITSAGTITHQASQRTLSYGAVASDAAKVLVPTEVQMKPPHEFSIIGTSRKNVDGMRIVTGQPLFGLDVDREGMLIAMIVHAPSFGMRLKSLDVEAACPASLTSSPLTHPYHKGSGLMSMPSRRRLSSWERPLRRS